jgi:hypothetical protein
MVIGDFNSLGITIMPLKVDSPLFIDANAMLSFPIAFKLFQAISWRNPEILNSFRSIQDKELSKRCSMNIPRKLFWKLTKEKLLSFRICEAFDHTGIIAQRTNSVNRY